MKFLHLIVLLVALPAAVLADTYTCSNCNKNTSQPFVIKGIAGQTATLCPSCYYLVPRCNVCNMPVKENGGKELSDGRMLCDDDYAVGIFTTQQVEEIFRDTRNELNRLFNRFAMTFPEKNVTVSIVSADRIYELAGRKYDAERASIYGLTKPKFFDAKGDEMSDDDIVKKHQKPARIEYRVFLLNGLPKSRLMAVAAHEYAHVWQFENLKLDRVMELEGKTQEAFCELVAYQMMDYVNDSFEKAVIRANLYTSGQADLLMDIDRDFGFPRILAWMKNGVDLQINREDLDRIRLVNGETAPKAAASESPLTYGAAPLKIPETLMLKGILGSGSKKMALINNQSFQVSEKMKVRVGNTNIMVQLVDIRDRSVLVRTNDVAETTEIFLQAK